MKKVNLPLTNEIIKSLKAGDQILLSGTLLTARDAAHKKMIEHIERGEKLPFEIKGQIIYYTGPCPARPGKIIGPAGPTTSGRMDTYTPKLLDLGLIGMIGKGNRNDDVVKAIKRNEGVYFGTVGGAGALISKCITSERILAWTELGAEAVREIEVVDFPAFVLIDYLGNNLYEINREKYKRM